MKPQDLGRKNLNDDMSDMIDMSLFVHVFAMLQALVITGIGGKIN